MSTGDTPDTTTADPQLANRYGRRAVALYLACAALIVAAGLLGPSVVVLTLTNRHAWLPSYWFNSKPNDWLVTVMLDGTGSWRWLRSRT